MVGSGQSHTMQQQISHEKFMNREGEREEEMREWKNMAFYQTVVHVQEDK